VNIYVGNLPLEVTEDELHREFAAFGEVTSVIIMNDKYIGSGQPRGYAFVEMASKPEGVTAVSSLSDKWLKGHRITVIEALPLSNRNAGEAIGIGGHNRAGRNRAGKQRERKHLIS